MQAQAADQWPVAILVASNRHHRPAAGGFASWDRRSLAYTELDPEPPFVEGDDISWPRSMGNPLSAWAKVREAAFASAEAIAAELRSASAPDLAMLVVAGRHLR
jgi:hypothetical protein